jgi:hypothetical protein
MWCSWYVCVETYSCEELRILAGGAHVCLDAWMRVWCCCSSYDSAATLSCGATAARELRFTPWSVLLYSSILVFGGANGSSGAVGCRWWEVSCDAGRCAGRRRRGGLQFEVWRKVLVVYRVMFKDCCLMSRGVCQTPGLRWVCPLVSAGKEGLGILVSSSPGLINH